MLPHRTEDFDPDSWKDLLSLGEIRAVEAKCERAMKELGYPVFDPKQHSASKRKS